ncbi:HIT domain-containing protein [bacterium]|nr:HIT domain-containing protein [bacterium]NUN44269.1 HIT domain-containing protein [bacterium]HMV26346.1 HIT domain-containing protein [bacterium]HMW34487.1 HIT domain-containing protein [bacterium]HMW37561.1 HIT domain-containing protein [bacterium]
MEHLWAPWRMRYIKAGDKNEGEGCIFCFKPQEDRDRENMILFRSTHNFVIMNLYPYNNGHLMVVPYQHAPDINALPPETLLDMMTTTQKCVTAFQRSVKPDGFNIGFNLGRTAGAGIDDHVHMHVVPRWNGDTNFMPVIMDTKVMPEYLEQTYDRLLAEFSQMKK